MIIFFCMSVCLSLCTSACVCVCVVVKRRNMMWRISTITWRGRRSAFCSSSSSAGNQLSRSYTSPDTAGSNHSKWSTTRVTFTFDPCVLLTFLFYLFIIKAVFTSIKQKHACALCETTLAAWHSGRTSVFGRRTFPVLRPTCSWRVTGDGYKSTNPANSAFHPFWVDRCVVSCN